MFSALVALLGGSTFRMVWGEVSAYLTSRLEHTQEMELMRLQADLAQEAHRRQQDSIRLQADLGIKVIEAQRDADIDSRAMDAWTSVATSTTRRTGFTLVDAWNGSIRPLLATLAILVVVGEVVVNGFVLASWHQDLVAAILGLYIADRSLSKRGK